MNPYKFPRFRAKVSQTLNHPQMQMYNMIPVASWVDFPIPRLLQHPNIKSGVQSICRIGWKIQGNVRPKSTFSIIQGHRGSATPFFSATDNGRQNTAIDKWRAQQQPGLGFRMPPAQARGTTGIIVMTIDKHRSDTYVY